MKNSYSCPYSGVCTCRISGRKNPIIKCQQIIKQKESSLKEAKKLSEKRSKIKYISYNGKNWPDAVSNGLETVCEICYHKTKFDYQVDDWVWNLLVPKDIRNSVVCLPCLDNIAKKIGIHIGIYLTQIQFTGHGHTVVLEPKSIVEYE